MWLKKFFQGVTYGFMFSYQRLRLCDVSNDLLSTNQLWAQNAKKLWKEEKCFTSTFAKYSYFPIDIEQV